MVSWWDKANDSKHVRSCESFTWQGIFIFWNFTSLDQALPGHVREPLVQLQLL